MQIEYSSNFVKTLISTTAAPRSGHFIYPPKWTLVADSDLRVRQHSSYRPPADPLSQRCSVSCGYWLLHVTRSVRSTSSLVSFCLHLKTHLFAAFSSLTLNAILELSFCTVPLQQFLWRHLNRIHSFIHSFIHLMQNLRIRGRTPPIIFARIDRPVSDCLTTLSVKIFTQRNFVADFLQLDVQFYTINSHFASWVPHREA